ncbi:MAG: RdgB/HAM1 family non-canonical purine NTP pyrophosphatase [Parahaliea sp.]
MMAPSSDIVLASTNVGKLKELAGILAPLGLNLRSQAEFQLPEVDENGLSFVENALIKARAAAAYSKLPAIADDSGLEVDALAGAPGIHSARYASAEEGGQNGRTARDAANNRKLLTALAEQAPAQRSARFVCVLVYLRHAEDPTPLICQGSWHGTILEQERGAGGFGYDPLFYVPEQDCSAAELATDLKNRISHRARACALLAEALRTR